MLAVLPEDTEVPLAVVGQLWWQKDEVETEELVMKLALWKVVEMNSQTQTLSLIDLHLDHLQTSGKDDLPGSLLRGCEESKIDKDTKGYWSREHLLHHLRGCEGIEGVRDLAPKLTSLDLSEMEGLTSLPHHSPLRR